MKAKYKVGCKHLTDLLNAGWEKVSPRESCSAEIQEQAVTRRGVGLEHMQQVQRV